MKTTSRLAAFLLIAVFAVFLAGLRFLLADEPAGKEDYLEKADAAHQRAAEAKKAGDYEAGRKAKDEEIAALEYCVAETPDNLALQERYGFLLAECHHNAVKFASVIEVLEKILERDAERTSARRKLIELLIEWERYNDACEHVDYLLKKSPDDAAALAQQGRCFFSMSRSEKAKESLEKAIAISPQQVEAYRYLSYVLRQRMNRPQEADALMEKMLAANAESAEAHFLFGQYLLQLKAEASNPQEALKHAEKALALDPEHTAAAVLAVRCLLAADDLPAARERAERIFARHKQPDGLREDLYFLLVEIERRSDHGEKSLALLQEGFKETKNLQFLWYQTAMKIDAGQFDDAQKQIKQLAVLNYAKPGLEYLRGKIFFLQGKWLEAVRTLEAARTSPAPVSGTQKITEYMLGVSYGRLLNSDQQIAAFRRALAIDPNFEPAKQALAEALLRAKKIGAAQGEAELTLENTKTPPSRLTLIQLSIEKTRQQPEGKQHWEEVQKLIDQSAKDFPDTPQFVYYRCLMLETQNRSADTDLYLRGLLEKEPKNADYWRYLLHFSTLRKDWKQVVVALESFEKAVGDTVDARLLRADYYVQRYAAEARPRLLELEANVDRFTDAEKCRLWSGLLSAATIVDDKEMVRRLSTLLAQKDPDNLQMQLMRLDQAYNSGNDSSMEEVLKNLERIEGQGPFWLYGQALLLTRKAAAGDPALLDEALKHLERARTIRESWPKLPLLMAQIYDQKKDFAAALKCYKEGIELGDHNPAVLLRVVQLLIRRQSCQEIDDLLRRWESEHIPFGPGLSQLWADALLQLNKFDAAMEKARKLVAENDGDYRYHLWLGQMAATVSCAKQRLDLVLGPLQIRSGSRKSLSPCRRTQGRFARYAHAVGLLFDRGREDQGSRNGVRGGPKKNHGQGRAVRFGPVPRSVWKKGGSQGTIRLGLGGRAERSRRGPSGGRFLLSQWRSRARRVVVEAIGRRKGHQGRGNRSHACPADAGGAVVEAGRGCEPSGRPRLCRRQSELCSRFDPGQKTAHRARFRGPPPGPAERSHSEPRRVAGGQAG